MTILRNYTNQSDRPAATTLAGSKDSSKGAVLERNDYAHEFYCPEGTHAIIICSSQHTLQKKKYLCLYNKREERKQCSEGHSENSPQPFVFQSCKTPQNCRGTLAGQVAKH
jgi:predicted RNA-binding Zn-ribbon protein involved in translation (DUF1610 family)